MAAAFITPPMGITSTAPCTARGWRERLARRHTPTRPKIDYQRYAEPGLDFQADACLTKVRDLQGGGDPRQPQTASLGIGEPAQAAAQHITHAHAAGQRREDETRRRQLSGRRPRWPRPRISTGRLRFVPHKPHTASGHRPRAPLPPLHQVDPSDSRLPARPTGSHCTARIRAARDRNHIRPCVPSALMQTHPDPRPSAGKDSAVAPFSLHACLSPRFRPCSAPRDGHDTFDRRAQLRRA